MDDIKQYIAAAIDRQVDLVKDLALSLSRYYGLEPEFLKAVSALDAAGAEKEYKDGIIKRNALLLAAVDGVDLQKWESILEGLATDLPFHQHPFVQAFNRIAESKGLSARLHDTGPKDYCTAKIKAFKSHGGDISKIDDINRVMIEMSDPDADRKVCSILAHMQGVDDVSSQEKRDMQGFVSDVYRLKFKDASSAEIAFVPCGLVASSAMTHNALRFRRASKFIEDGATLERLYKAACASIRKKFNMVSKDIPLDKKVIAALDLKEFSLEAANKKLQTFENECLHSVLDREVNKKWKSAFGGQ